MVVSDVVSLAPPVWSMGRVAAGEVVKMVPTNRNPRDVLRVLCNPEEVGFTLLKFAQQPCGTSSSCTNRLPRHAASLASVSPSTFYPSINVVSRSDLSILLWQNVKATLQLHSHLI